MDIKGTSGRLLLAAALAVAAAACGDDGGSGDAAETTTAPADTGSEGDGGDGGDDTTTEPADEGCTTDLELVGTDGADGPVEPGTVWADAGPHPDNTVDYDRSLELVIASFELPIDEQFGRSIPIAPDVPEGELVVTAYLSNDADAEVIGAGQTFSSATDAPEDVGTINNVTAFVGTDRLLLGDVTITITELTDEQVCGEIATVVETDLQQFAGIEGTFALDRIQALDAADES